MTSKVIGQSLLRLSLGITKPLATISVLGACGLSMWLRSKVVLNIPSGITYALWSGIGKQVPSPGQLVGVAKITTGVIIVNPTGKHP